MLAATVNWDIATGGLLTLTGAQSAANLRNNGTLRFHDPAATLTAATLSGNGAISMEIDLDAAPAAPRLIITGQADGRHRLDITTIGEPDDPRDIHIPLVTYATGDATFTSNTITDPEGNAYAARQDGGTVTFVFTGNNTGGDVICITSGALGMDWHYSLDSLRQRMGEVRGAISPTGLIAGTGDAPGVMGDIWFRANLYRLRADAGLVGAAFDQTSYDLTAGLDRALALDGASLLLGGFATMTRSNRDHDINDSKSDSDGIGAGLYATLLGKTGWHLDLIAKYHHYTNTIDANNGDRRVTRGDYASNALGASLELGRRLTLKKRLWTELSAQAAYARFAHGDYTATSTTGKSRPIRVDAANSLQTRAQLRAGADLGRWQPHARLAGVFNAASGGTPQVKGFTPAKPDFSGWRLEAGAGATLMVDERTLLYLDYEYNQAETYRRPWAVALGLRRTW
ncbi:MAG: autotransporter outer membrane beta-barrel domain-containing protein [Opitutaceae bacterium]|nr:autotransporter outer membrane beta-barrel domain-containing protein [Opitutaceae bacterium]